MEDLWVKLEENVKSLKPTHIKEMLTDQARNDNLNVQFENIFMDFSRTKMNNETLDILGEIAASSGLFDKIRAMYNFEAINSTEGRQVFHVGLRLAGDPEQPQFPVYEDVNAVNARIKAFAEKVRSGELKSVAGKAFKTFLVVGIGGSYLGVDFLNEALSLYGGDFSLKFVANVDPVDFMRVTRTCDPSETLVIIISKTFTTAETMMNADRVRKWLIAGNADQAEADVVASNMVAVSTNLELTAKFGIKDDNVFGFWDWVGGRYSASSAVGLLPLYLTYGNIMDDFLAGMRSVDVHFRDNATPENWRKNLPLLLGLLGILSINGYGFSHRAIVPYSQSLLKFCAHIQQLDMESSGKQCKTDGTSISETGPVVFGEPGTNSQHSYFQLMHQGRAMPAEFIGYCKSQSADTEAHTELMCNFFAQSDALALGKDREALLGENCPEEMIPHKTFDGDRPSLSILFNELNAYTIGQLLAIYEHRVATEGFVWGINSFDQYGVELGKVLAGNFRNLFKTEINPDTLQIPSPGLFKHFLANRG